MAKIVAVTILLALGISLVVVLQAPVFFQHEWVAFGGLAAFLAIPYLLLLAECYRSRDFLPAVVLVGVAAIVLASLHAFVVFASTWAYVDEHGRTLRTTNGEGEMGYGFFVIFQFLVVILIVVIVEVVHFVRRRRAKH